MTNQTKMDTLSTRRFAKCPSTIASGDPVLLGTIAAVALDSYDSILGGTTFCTDGSYALAVTAASTQSPVSGLAIAPNAELYATGSYDATTGVTHGLTIDLTRGGTPFGNAEVEAAVTAGTTSTISVRLKVGGSPGPYAA